MSTIQFGTVEVYEEMARLLNEDTQWLEDAKNISFTMIYAYGEPVNAAFYVRFDAGRVVDVHQLASAADEPADFVISGSADVWRGVLEKRVSPTAALTRGQLKLKGKMTTLMKHMGQFSHVLDTMSQVQFV